MIDFSCKLIERGWFRATLMGENNNAEFTASYLSDAPYDLIIAVALLCEGVNEAKCLWQDEPGEYQWIFKRQNNCLELKVLQSEKTFSHQISENAQIVFYGKENLSKFAHKILRAFNVLKIEYTTDGYKNLWGYEFPLQALNRLKIEVKAIKS